MNCDFYLNSSRNQCIGAFLSTRYEVREFKVKPNLLFTAEVEGQKMKKTNKKYMYVNGVHFRILHADKNCNDSRL